MTLVFVASYDSVWCSAALTVCNSFVEKLVWFIITKLFYRVEFWYYLYCAVLCVLQCVCICPCVVNLW